jgi:hypothetical protein
VNILKAKTGQSIRLYNFYPNDLAAKVSIYRVSADLPCTGFDNSPMWGTISTGIRTYFD